MLRTVDSVDERNEREKASILKALDVMWAKYLPDIRERANVLNAAADAADAGTLNDDLCSAAKDAAHKLAGTLGTFGLARATELARGLEARFALGGITENDTPCLRESALQIRAMIESRE